MKKIRKPKFKEKLAALGVIVGGAGIGILYYFIPPMLSEQESVSQQIAAAEQKATSSKDKSGELKKLKVQAEELKQKVEARRDKNDFQINTGNLLTVLGNMANRLDVEISKMEELAVRDNAIPGYKEFPYKISLQGDYHDILLFVYGLDTLKTNFYAEDILLKQIEIDRATGEPVKEGSEFDKESFSWTKGKPTLRTSILEFLKDEKDEESQEGEGMPATGDPSGGVSAPTGAPAPSGGVSAPTGAPDPAGMGGDPIFSGGELPGSSGEGEEGEGAGSPPVDSIYKIQLDLTVVFVSLESDKEENSYIENLDNSNLKKGKYDPFEGSFDYGTLTFDENNNLIYTVQEGETLATVAKYFEIEEADLRKANELKDGDEVKEGQSLIIPLTNSK